MSFQAEKKLILDLFADMEQANPDTIESVLNNYVSNDYLWRGVYPFREQQNAAQAASLFWVPLIKGFSRLRRHQDIFIAGRNKYDGEVWVMSMGHFMGLFDQDILGIPHTRKLATLRYAEFHCVVDGKITQTGVFVDFIGLMAQAGVYPLPPSTGAYFMYPGPRTHDGLMYEDAPADQAAETLALLDKMVDDLSELNDSGSMGCPPELLEQSWSKDMLWYGPAGIGATYTIERYQEQHQLPFRASLTDKKFNGHICRFAEGHYSCFFGWPNLKNKHLGGWLGLPGSGVTAEMQVVDVYRREGDKLVENWVLLDIPYWLSQQGVDVFERTAEVVKRNL